MCTKLLRSTKVGIVCAVAFLLIPGWSYAKNPFLDQAIPAYENFEYDKALRLLELAEKHSGSSQGDLARVNLYFGLVRFTLGDKKAAEEAFRKALELDSEISLPPDTSPKITATFDNIKKSLSPQKIQPPVEGNKPPVQKNKPITIVKTPPVLPPEQPPSPRKRIWTWVVGGIGAGTLVAGAIMGGLSLSAKNAFENEPWADSANDLKDQAETYSLSANVLLVTGGAALAGALVLFFLENGSKEPDGESTRHLSVSINPQSFGMEASIRF